MATLGAVQFLEDHLEDLYREVKNRRFSVLIACEYDTRKRTIKSVEALTLVYGAEGVA